MADSIVRSASWMLLFRMADRALGFISTIVLARLLVPADFGLVAMAMSVIAIIEVLNSFGFEMALIQTNDPTEEHYDTVWTLNLGLGIIGAALTAIAAYPAALFFSDPRLVSLMLVLAGNWVIRGLGNVGVVNFRRHMNFQREFTFLSTRRLLGFIVTLGIAYSWRTYWALVIGIVTTQLSSLVLSYLMEPYRPVISVAKWRELVGYSKWLLTQNVMLIFIIRFPHFVIGRVLGAQSLGLFTVGNELGSLPVSELSAPVNRAVFPAYSRLAGDRGSMKQSYLRVGSAVLLAALPASLGIALIADPAVNLLLGETWRGAIPLVQISALAAACMAAAGNNGIAALALGVPRVSAAVQLVRLLVLVPFSIYLVRVSGAMGVAIADLIAAASCLAVSFPLVWRRLGVSWWEYMANAWRPIVASLAMAVAVQLVNRQWTAAGNSGTSLLSHLVSAIACGILTYSICIWLLWLMAGKPAGPEAYARERLAVLLRRVAA